MAMTRPLSEQVRFTQEGAGAVERLASEKLREWVSVKDFGAVGDGVTDDTAAIQAAIDSVLSSGMSLTACPAAVYKITSGLVANGPLNFDLCGSTIDGRSIAVGTTYNEKFVLKVSGDIESPTAVTLDVAEASTSLTVADTAGFTEGDYVFLSSSQLMVDGYGNAGNKRGELCRIKTVTSGTVLELVSATLFSYSSLSSARVQKINPAVGVDIRNGTLLGGGTDSRHTGLQLHYCVKPSVTNLNITGGNDVGIATFFCYGGRIVGGRIKDSDWLEPGDSETSGGTGYGICLYSATRDFLIDSVHFQRCNRATTGGGSYPSVHCLVRFCLAEDMMNGFGGHEPCWWWTVEDCVVRRATNVGVNCRGQFTKIHRCKFFDTGGYAINVRSYYFNPLGVRGTELVDNEFIRSGGIILDGTAAEGRVVNTTIRGGRHEYCKFNNITIRRADGVLIDGVRFVSQNVIGANDGQAIAISGTAAVGDNCSDVTISNCEVVNAARRGFQAFFVQNLVVSGNNIRYAMSDGIYLESCQDSAVVGNRVRGGDVAFTSPIRVRNSSRTTVTGNDFVGKNDVALTSNHGIMFSASGGICEDNVAVGNSIGGCASAVIVSGTGVNHSVVVGNNGRNCYGATKFSITSANQQVANNLS